MFLSLRHCIMEAAIVKYQDPMEADKILKIQKELDDTKVVLHKTIDSVLARGEKLDNLAGRCKLDPSLKAHPVSNFDCEKDITVLST